LEWIDQIDQYAQQHNLSFEDVAKYKTFEAKNINWGTESDPADYVNISYETLEKISKFNAGANQSGKLTGYILISD
jgi:hypothetical protein